MSDRREHFWSRHAHVSHGGLAGWCSRCSVEKRHSALRKVVERDGYAATVKRLNFLHNVANRRNNGELRKVAESDLHWVEREFGGDYSHTWME
jgi:hypothetical protein